MQTIYNAPVAVLSMFEIFFSKPSICFTISFDDDSIDCSNASSARAASIIRHVMSREKVKCVTEKKVFKKSSSLVLSFLNEYSLVLP